MISKEKIHDYTDIYVESYMRALEKVHNPDLAVQAAMGIVTVLRTLEQQQEEIGKCNESTDRFIVYSTVWR